MTLKLGHSQPDGEEQAALYVLGLLGHAAATSFEAHVAEGCADCEEDIRALEWTSNQLALAGATTPPPALRDRVLAITKTAGAGRSTVRADATPWEPSGFPGITVRRLHIDRAQSRQTILVRMEAGASYQPHRHNAAEESFVLEGDVTADGETLAAGDYHRADKDSLHGVQTTESGCLLLVISSMHDDFVDDPPRP